jgi:hypothetical protein
LPKIGNFGGNNIGSEENRHFRRKLSKVGGSSDHNIVPEENHQFLPKIGEIRRKYSL